MKLLVGWAVENYVYFELERTKYFFFTQEI